MKRVLFLGLVMILASAVSVQAGYPWPDDPITGYPWPDLAAALLRLLGLS